VTLIVQCPACAEQEDESKVFPLGCSATLLSYAPYYDEQGVAHYHDPNATTSSYRCSKGHVWNVKSYKECPACGWRKADDLVIAPKW